MWSTTALEWNALLNRARSALLEQEDLLAVLEHPRRPAITGNLPDLRKARADWGATRRRFLHAYYRLAELSGAAEPSSPVELRMIVARLEVSARNLQERYQNAVENLNSQGSRSA